VRLVDERVAPRAPRRAVVAPGVGRVFDDTLRDHGGGVATVEGQVGTLRAQPVPVQRIVPADAAEELARIRIDEQLVRVESMPALGLVGAVNPVAVELARPQALDVHVPNLVRTPGQADALGLASPGRVEETKIHCGCVGREQGEIHAFPVPGRAEGEGRALVDPSHRC